MCIFICHLLSDSGAYLFLNLSFLSSCDKLAVLCFADLTGGRCASVLLKHNGKHDGFAVGS